MILPIISIEGLAAAAYKQEPEPQHPNHLKGLVELAGWLTTLEVAHEANAHPTCASQIGLREALCFASHAYLGAQVARRRNLH